MSVVKVVVAIIFIVIVAIALVIIFFPQLFLPETVLPYTSITTTSATTTTETVSNASTEFEVEPGTTVSMPITIDSQNFGVKATNKVFPIFGVVFKAPAVSFNEAAKIAYKAADLNTINEITLEYKVEQMVYTVSGYAKDSFYNYDVENFRVITISDSGDVKSISKEPLIFSFVKGLGASTVKIWQH